MSWMKWILLVAPVVIHAQTSYIVRVPDIQNFLEFAGSEQVEPLVSYPEPSNEVRERFGQYYVLEAAPELIDSYVNAGCLIEVFADHRNRIEPLEDAALTSFQSFYNPADTVLYTYHIPNDPFFCNQWDKKITETQWAWELTTGSKDIVVAILDTGIDTLHEDLRVNLVAGYNFVATSESIQDVYGHGTHVSGIVAAEIDNETGIAGMSQSGIMALKVVDDEGYYLDSDLIDGIIYAAEYGADIISMSLVGDEHEPIPLIQDAVTYAWDKGLFLVAIAGNGGRNGSVYPGAYERVMSVGSTKPNDTRASDSNYGDGVDIYAPGYYIYSTMPNDKYRYRSGTSMAGPQVAGLAALIWSCSPDYTNLDVWSRIVESADTIQIDMGEALRMNSRKTLGIISEVEERVCEIQTFSARINKGVITLRYRAPGKIPFIFTVFDATGRKLASKKGMTEEEGVINLNQPNLSEGVYFFRFQAGFSVSTGKYVFIHGR
ncbi:peptidase S8 [candidate division WOR-3 bacterium]|nr:peptidase S8 [candidate division WOR-3 bacterium]